MKTMILVLALGVLAGCAPTSSAQETPSAAAFATEQPSPPSELQTLPRDLKFERTLAALDFNARGARWEYKTRGTSLGLKLQIDNKKMGKWLPANGAANPEAQVVAYRLGRFLQMSENVAPSAYYTLKGAALESLRKP